MEDSVNHDKLVSVLLVEHERKEKEEERKKNERNKFENGEVKILESI